MDRQSEILTRDQAGTGDAGGLASGAGCEVWASAPWQVYGQNAREGQVDKRKSDRRVAEGKQPLDLASFAI